MLTDIQIAQNATLRPIDEIAAELGIAKDELLQYGHDKAKLTYQLEARVKDNPDGKLKL